MKVQCLFNFILLCSLWWIILASSKNEKSYLLLCHFLSFQILPVDFWCVLYLCLVSICYIFSVFTCFSYNHRWNNFPLGRKHLLGKFCRNYMTFVSIISYVRLSFFPIFYIPTKLIWYTLYRYITFTIFKSNFLLLMTCHDCSVMYVTFILAYSTVGL